MFLTSRPPFPVSGDRVRVRQQIAWLARTHDIEVLTLVRSPAELEHVEQLRAEGLQVTSVPVRRFEAASGLVRAGLRGRPLQTGYFDSAAMAAELHRIVTTAGTDIVYFHLVRMAQYWAEDAPYAQVLDMCDALSVQYRERAELRSGGEIAWRTVDRAESRRLAAWEESIVRKFDAVSIISDADAASIKGARPPRVIPLHVQDCLDYDCGENATANEILFAGEMSTHYSRSAVQFLVTEVMPRVWAEIPGATVRIVGANPAADVVALAGPRVTVTGYVDDLRPHFVQAGVLACPIRIGTGLKTKVLQAMALRTPVVASTPANRGIEAADGQHLLIADDPKAFAAAIVRVLTQPGCRDRLRQHGRAFAEEHFSERAMGSSLDAFISDGLSRAAVRQSAGRPVAADGSMH